MRILLVDHVSKVLGGAEVNVLELLAHPGVRTHWEVTVARAPGSPLAEKVASLNWPSVDHRFGEALNELRIVGKSFNLMGKVRGWQELRRATARLESTVRAVQPHVILSCTNKDHFAAGEVARRTGCASVWWMNDILSGDFFGWAVRRVFVAKGAALASMITPVSEFGRQALLHEGLPADRCQTVHNGIPLERYVAAPNRPLRQQLGLAPDEPLFGLVGRITPWKGQDFFVRVAAEWARLGRRGCFVIIGRAFNEDRDYEESVKSAIAAHGLETRVRCVSFQSEVAAALSSLDVLVHCSLKPEPFGRVLIEAMAVGTPVVGARGGGTPEIIDDQITGALLPPGDLSSYITGLERALEFGRSRWAPAAKRVVTERFSLDRVFADFNRILQSAANRRHRG